MLTNSCNLSFNKLLVQTSYYLAGLAGIYCLFVVVSKVSAHDIVKVMLSEMLLVLVLWAGAIMLKQSNLHNIYRQFREKLIINK